ncbi:MAG: hypothetical protein IPP94_11940 [Ignavibacteria bacterium]|nr:hypothetical protein [Ignavibacteria bacterium]
MGYTLSGVTAIAAVIILTGVFLPPSVPAQLRITFGIVLVLLAVYRFVITWVQEKQARRSGRD